MTNTVTVTKFPEMPDFLWRNPDNTLMHPKPWGKIKPLKVPAYTPEEGIQRWSDIRLQEALDSDMTLLERQPIYHEMRRRADKVKIAERIAKMKAALADRTGED